MAITWRQAYKETELGDYRSVLIKPAGLKPHWRCGFILDIDKEMIYIGPEDSWQSSWSRFYLSVVEGIY